jgi:hypothetical protein
LYYYNSLICIKRVSYWIFWITWPVIIFDSTTCDGAPFSKFYKQSVLHMLTLWVIIHHCVVCSSSIYGFWLPLWYILTLLTSNQHCSYVHFTKHLFYRLIFTEASVCIFCREITRPYNPVVNTHIALYSIFFSTSYRGRLKKMA